MPRYQRYLLRQLIGPFLLVTVGLTAVVWLSQSLRIIDLIVNKGLSFSAFLLMSMLVLPTFLSAILPIAFFCALLFVYNKLTIDSELVSLRAAGVSQWSLAKPALVMATIVVVVSYAIIMYVMPVSHQGVQGAAVRPAQRPLGASPGGRHLQHADRGRHRLHPWA